jgi:hypothetical protein
MAALLVLIELVVARDRAWARRVFPTDRGFESFDRCYPWHYAEANLAKNAALRERAKPSKLCRGQKKTKGNRSPLVGPDLYAPRSERFATSSGRHCVSLNASASNSPLVPQR